MASKQKQAIISVALLAGAAAISTLLYLQRPPAEISEPSYAAVSVDVAEVVKVNPRIQVQAQGTVTPVQETTLLSEVKGRIIEVADNFHVGGFVSTGDVLLRIDPRDYQTALLHAEAAVESAESALVQEKGRAEVALREWEKLPRGSQRSEEARDLYLRKPQLEQARAQLLAAQADLNTARDNLDRTVIRAPYDALIREKLGDLGQFVGAGTMLAKIFSVEAAEVRLPIPQSRLEYLELPGVAGYEEGSLIDLYTDVGGDIKHWNARLHRTEGVFDERSRVLFTVARIDDPYALRHPGREPLRIGTFVNANIEGRELADVVVLPRYVLRAGEYVWVVDDSMRLRNRKVSTLRTGGDKVYIDAGLDAGELVSLTNLNASFAGAEVEIKSRTRSDKLDQPGAAAAPDLQSPPGAPRTAATATPASSVAGGQ
ncbi:MAG: efflux RND transporter periplasmic adaptor subunit [Halieaceae bacterium]|nr:efflux RND transporter periplasmic adaptor subunit [Halieaceae bacterium]MCP5148121.1 efflux RND transporter periplasmic adaptor subunit [Pseudomonadales bacterium]MCP5167268.1 efflux RND transporter periplasmic adaptor subunit [Pseudomonadales bacterium]MCP5187742.1 efflux RND transporter periplasmic adaptor subunit [Pseudomonadales bacterium]